MKTSEAIATLVISFLLALAGNVAHACSAWEDDEGMWNQEGCTLDEVIEKAGPEIANLPPKRTIRLCDVQITQQDMYGSLPYFINQPGIYCIAEDLAVPLRDGVQFPPEFVFRPFPPVAIAIESDRTSLWFKGHELRNTGNSLNSLVVGGAGVGIAPGADDVWISHGQITGFWDGIIVTNFGGGALSRIKIHDMDFAPLFDGIAFGGNSISRSSIYRNRFQRTTFGVRANIISNSTIHLNSFQGCFSCIAINRFLDSKIEDNTFLPMRSNQPSISAIDVAYSENGKVQKNSITGDPSLSASGSISIPYYGIAIRDGQNVSVEHNTITGMMYGISLRNVYSNTQASTFVGGDNVIRSNEIFGGAGNQFLPGHGYQIPAASDGVAGIQLVGQRGLLLKGNRIYSGQNKGYPTGIAVDNTTTFATSNAGTPQFSENETCGTLNPVSDAALQALVEAQNEFEVCRYRY